MLGCPTAAVSNVRSTTAHNRANCLRGFIPKTCSHHRLKSRKIKKLCLITGNGTTGAERGAIAAKDRKDREVSQEVKTTLRTQGVGAHKRSRSSFLCVLCVLSLRAHGRILQGGFL